MSGFEVVGVVLGAIPLVLSALNACKSTKKTIRLIRKKDVLLDQLIQSLREQEFFIQTDICLALKKTDLTETDIIDMLNDTGFNMFQRPEITDALRDHMGAASTFYTATVAECEKILQDIVVRISGLVSTSQALSTLIENQPSKDGQFEFTKRIRFSIRSDELKAQIRSLDDATKKLTHLRETGAERQQHVTTKPTSRTARRLTAAFNSVNSHAQILFSAVSRGPLPACHSHHEVRLFLQTRSSAMNTKTPRRLNTPPVNFTISFFPLSVDLHPLTLPERYAVEALDDQPNTAEESPVVSQTTVPIEIPNSRQNKSVRLPQQVADLCRLMQRVHSSKISIQLYLSRRAEFLYMDAPGTLLKATETAYPSTITLKDMLSQMQQQGSPMPRLTVYQKLALSLRIASSILQLHSTPWLEAPLTSSSIRFMCDAVSFVHIPQPFIVRRLADQSHVAPSCSAKSSLLELGIILLEIWHVKSFDQYASEAGEGKHDTYGARYEIAKHWLDSGDEIMLPFFLELVTRCVEGTFAIDSTSLTLTWSDLTFRRSLCEYVMQPLWENCPHTLR
ncbi:hypothetical protein BP00DRAFT_465516 [Aspergillus indologenus CBS 114.80]|uniref:DUF7580 domain-containing protein n=1 Tax=Aspergillus indologenus CBS 114.80 TaxID=1450541 RepID=A0A2V5IKB5_9EURO|nr:hypothetical protein BP00DRAFT_465516 [Aspergillus indologenus CBS 114.80]